VAELKTPGGDAVDLDAVKAGMDSAFESVMNADDAPPPTPAKVERTPKPERARTRRQPKDEKPRTKPEPPVKTDYTEDAQQLVGGLWTVAAAVPMTQPYALVVDANSDALVSALAAGAKQNSTLRRFVASGENTWMLQLASVGMSMGMQAFQIARDPQLRAGAAETTRAKLRQMLSAQGIELPEPAAAALCPPG